MADALQEMGLTVVGRREDVNEETLSRLEALTDDEDDDDVDHDERRDKRLRGDSSSSSSSDLGDESIEGEYVLDPPKVDDAERDLHSKLSSTLVTSSSPS